MKPASWYPGNGPCAGPVTSTLTLTVYCYHHQGADQEGLAPWWGYQKNSSATTSAQPPLISAATSMKNQHSGCRLATSFYEGQSSWGTLRKWHSTGQRACHRNWGVCQTWRINSTSTSGSPWRLTTTTFPSLTLISAGKLMAYWVIGYKGKYPHQLTWGPRHSSSS
jgi:hypothetical protein